MREMTLSIDFDNSYARLPDRFYTRMAPVPVRGPMLVALNRALAEELGIDPDALTSAEGVAALAGNDVPEGAEPLAQVYAGHQFGGWVPQLGDGRAILLGEVVDTGGRRRDIQLKGAGRTPYSRMGDGRAWLGPVMREYVVSEAMHALGIPTTRALAAVTTGETVLREAPLPGAVLTRVAASHIRVGTFQYFAARGDTDALATLTDHAIARHCPQAEGALGLLDHVVAAQARLVAQWMGVGFIHGVMNTDNTSVAGETIDYGPCAFLDAYEPGKVFSSIDQFGRYAFNRQADVMVWNLAQFATALLPVTGMEQEAAIEAATAAVHRFPDAFRAAWHEVFLRKIGIENGTDEDADLLNRLLDLMADGRADFTNTFRGLAAGRIPDLPGAETWAADWRARLDRETAPGDVMTGANPARIPRNHRIEQAIAAALEDDFAPFRRLVAALAAPYQDDASFDDLCAPPTPDEAVQRTFCGT